MWMENLLGDLTMVGFLVTSIEFFLPVKFDSDYLVILEDFERNLDQISYSFVNTTH